MNLKCVDYVWTKKVETIRSTYKMGEFLWRRNVRAIWTIFFTIVKERFKRPIFGVGTLSISWDLKDVSKLLKS